MNARRGSDNKNEQWNKSYSSSQSGYGGYSNGSRSTDLRSGDRGTRSGDYRPRGGDRGNDSWGDQNDQRKSYEPDMTDSFVRDTFGGEQEGTLTADGIAPTEAELFKNHSTGINFAKYSDIPVSMTGNNVPLPIDTFAKAGLDPLIVSNIKRANYTEPTPVQKYAIPAGLAGRDLMACAQTGSGKTAAFLLPTLTKIMTGSLPPQRGMTRIAEPVFVVLAPTRELAIQIYKEALKFSYATNLRAVVVYGGAPFGNQARELERGAHIVVGTPGRLLDMLDRGKLSLQRVKYLCFDEADRMLDMGFEKQIRTIVEERDMPGLLDRQTTMFSATFPKEIRQLASMYLKDNLFLKIGRVGSTTDSITQIIKFIPTTDKRDAVIKELKEEKGKTLIFAETKRSTDQLARYIYSQGFPATGIHGDRTQREREAALESFKRGRVNVLVATDVASRGLDIPQVAHVINYDLPSAIDAYVHRIGRTGRAGHTGKATSFFNEEDGSLARDLIKTLETAKQEVPPFLLQKMHSSGGNGRGGRDRRYAQRSHPYSSGGYSSGGFGGSGGSGGPIRRGAGGSSFNPTRGGGGGSSFNPTRGGGGGDLRGNSFGHGGAGGYGGYNRAAPPSSSTAKLWE